MFFNDLAGKNDDKAIEKREKAKKQELEKAAPDLSPEKVFPTLVKIDNAGRDIVDAHEDITLENICLQFQAYASVNHKIYYELPFLRSFLAGLATSRLIILEGLSGTGKSMLPRMFARFTNSNAFFAPVQATQRNLCLIHNYCHLRLYEWAIVIYLVDL